MLKEYNSLDVANRLRDLADLRRVSMQQVLLDCGINRNAMTHMRTSMPNAGSLAKLADRLECSVDYLLGRSEDIQAIGSGQAPAPSPSLQVVEQPPQAALSRNASEMLALFDQLPDRDQVLLIGRLQNMVEQLQASEGGQGGSSESSPARAG